MLLKETYKLQLVFVGFFILIILANWLTFITRYTATVLVSSLFFIWVLALIVMVIKKTKRG